jgi:hypothetical protein
MRQLLQQAALVAVGIAEVFKQHTHPASQQSSDSISLRM